MPVCEDRAPIDQIGFVTDDLDHAVRFWSESLGVGPWQVYRNVALDGHYLGQPTRVVIDVALGYRGTEQIEFIQVCSDTPSPYQDGSGQPLAGLHHLAWIVDDLDGEAALLDACGMRRVFSAENIAVRVIYFADPKQPGVLFELICGAGSREGHDAGIALSRDWDGRSTLPEIDLGAAA